MSSCLNKWKSIKSATLILTVGIVLVAGAFENTNAAQPGSVSKTKVVNVSDGAIQGLVRNGMREFLGIPYAAPPVGNLRWEPPQPAGQWDGVKNTFHFADACPQTLKFHDFYTSHKSEDCLYLNVFTPATSDDKKPLPVMVWFHGGRLIHGSSSLYNPVKLVTRGNVIVVTLNYRLNIFGFFALPTRGKSVPKTANYGLLDQQFALEWVQKNISKFGGNPNNVTIFGQSTGGMSTLSQLISPKSNGLFQKAIVQSPAIGQVLRLHQMSLVQAEEQAEEFAKRVGCDDADISCLKSLSVAELQSGLGSYKSRVIVDGDVFPEDLGVALQHDDWAHVPVMIGNVRDERRFTYAIKELKSKKAITARDYRSALKEQYGDDAEKILGKYPLSDYGSASTALAAATTDSLMICRSLDVARELARTSPVYMYEFADRTAPFFFPPMPFPFGAIHTSELQYLFLHWHGTHGEVLPLNEAQRALSRKMVHYWTNFAQSDNPNGGHVPAWPKYNKNGQVQVLQLPTPFTVSAESHNARHHCGFWAGGA